MQYIDGKLVIDLQGPDGNAFAVIGSATKLLNKVASKEDIRAYRTTDTSGTYENLLKASKEFLEKFGIEMIDSSNLYPNIFPEVDFPEVEIELVVREKIERE